MELKKIADLINQGKLKEAKIKLIEIIEERKNLVEKLPSQEKSYENIYYTLSQVCSQLNELEEAKRKFPPSAPPIPTLIFFPILNPLPSFKFF